MGLSGDAQIVATNQNTRPMLVNTWKVDMFNRPGLFVTTAVQCVLIGRLCAIMSTSITEMKASKTESLTELPLESCPKSCFSSLFFF